MPLTLALVIEVLMQPASYLATWLLLRVFSQYLVYGLNKT